MILTKLLILLFAGHALCDYPLQGDFLSQGKNRLLKGIPWYQCLFSHSLIHAGMVLLVTHSVYLSLAELVIHAGIDYSKRAGYFGGGELAFNIDQGLHFACKIAWALITWWALL
jgi:hypothetical protein